MTVIKIYTFLFVTSFSHSELKSVMTRTYDRVGPKLISIWQKFYIRESSIRYTTESLTQVGGEGTWDVSYLPLSSLKTRVNPITTISNHYTECKRDTYGVIKSTCTCMYVTVCSISFSHRQKPFPWRHVVYVLT